MLAFVEMLQKAPLAGRKFVVLSGQSLFWSDLFHVYSLGMGAGNAQSAGEYGV